MWNFYEQLYITAKQYELYSKAASKDKNLFVVKDASHYDLYDQPEPVAQALEKIIPFFQKHL